MSKQYKLKKSNGDLSLKSGDLVKIIEINKVCCHGEGLDCHFKDRIFEVESNSTTFRLNSIDNKYITVKGLDTYITIDNLTLVDKDSIEAILYQMGY
jgi:hypothetical protein